MWTHFPDSTLAFLVSCLSDILTLFQILVFPSPFYLITRGSENILSSILTTRHCWYDLIVWNLVNSRWTARQQWRSSSMENTLPLPLPSPKLCSSAHKPISHSWVYLCNCPSFMGENCTSKFPFNIQSRIHTYKHLIDSSRPRSCIHFRISLNRLETQRHEVLFLWCLTVPSVNCAGMHCQQFLEPLSVFLLLFWPK